jgi:large subunit ribosomal protein L22
VRVSATAKYLRRSTRKTRLVTQAIVGRPVEEAAAILRFMPQAAARDVAKVLKSATANAENNHDLPADELFVAEATANEGPSIKRWRPRARGAAFPIIKPMTHVTIVVENREA